MTDLETIPETAPDTAPAPAASRTRQFVPHPFTKMGRLARQLWITAQDASRPDCPFISCGELAEILNATTESTSANLAQLRHRGLVVQIHKPRRSGRGTLALYGLTDAGAVACADVFAGR
jgi:hypothetical protein